LASFASALPYPSPSRPPEFFSHKSPGAFIARLLAHDRIAQAEAKARAEAEAEAMALGQESARFLTVPNLLTAGRLLATPWFGYTIVTGQMQLAFAIFTLAAASDWVRGLHAPRAIRFRVPRTTVCRPNKPHPRKSRGTAGGRRDRARLPISALGVGIRLGPAGRQAACDDLRRHNAPRGPSAV
jgi:hypothetical protein